MPDGSSKQIKIRAKNEKELEEKFFQKRMECEMGLLVFTPNTSFARWVEEWLKTYKQPNVTAKTLRDIKGLVQNVFVNYIGGMRVSDIKTVHIQNCLNRMNGKSQSRINKATNYIRDIFRKAEANELIKRNPTHQLVPPKGSIGNRRALSTDERKYFLRTVQKHPRGLLFAVSLACGLRPGEARALTKDCIILDGPHPIIKIYHAIESGSKQIKQPKSSAGIRDVPIPNWYKTLLEKYLPTVTGELVFPSASGKALTETGYKRAWASFFRLMDIEAGAELYRNQIIRHAIDQNLTPYYLRHTYATNLAEAGIDIKTAQYLLGHANIQMTAQIYTHVTSKMMSKAAEKINQISNDF